MQRPLSMMLVLTFVFVSIASAADDPLVRRDAKGGIRVNVPERPAAYVNVWDEAREAAYWERATPLIMANEGKIRTDTPGEHEKWSIPQTVLAYLAGTPGAAEALQVGLEPQSDDHAATLGVDLYWSFTLKGQMRKYFFFQPVLEKGYVERFRKAGGIWTETDVKPGMELVLALDSSDEEVRAYALEELRAMRAKIKPELIEQATNDDAKAAIREYLASDLSKEDLGDDPEKWSAWWQFFSDRGWKTFEEVERLMNIRPHPAHGIGTGPVGGAWDPKVRGFWADARNTDNLRGMREVAIYLMAEEAGNERTRKLYKEKLRRTAKGFLGMGMGEWDSPAYHAHSLAAYLNLYDFAKDPEVVGYAKAILDYLSTAGAVKYVHGGWSGPNKRDYGTLDPMDTASAAFYPWYGAASAEHAESDLEHAFIFTSAYRPPAAVAEFAKKQFGTPVEMMNTHPEYENWLPGKGDAPLYHETIYIGDTFQLGTLLEGNDGYDTAGFKLLMQNGEGTVDFVVAGSNQGDTLKRHAAVSSAGGDAVGQYRNLAVLLNAEHPDATFFVVVPESTKREEEKGVTFIQGEKTWIALRPINASTFEAGKVKVKGGKGYDGKVILGSTGKGGDIAGFALEVGDAKTHGSYDQFKRDVLSKSKLEVSGRSATLARVDGESVRLDVGADGEVKLSRNGEAVDVGSWRAVYDTVSPESGAPRVELGWKERKLTVEAGRQRFVGEFKENGEYVTTNEAIAE